MIDQFTGKEVFNDKSNASDVSNMPYPIELGDDGNRHEYFQNNKPYVAPEIQKSYSFYDTFIDDMKNEGFMKAYNYNVEQSSITNPLNDPVDSSWTPKSDPSVFEGVSPKYAGIVLAATGPKDAIRRQAYAMSLQERDDRYANGSTLGHLTAGFASGMEEPWNWLPIGSVVRSARLGSQVLSAIGKASPSMFAAAIGNAGFKQFTQNTKDINEFVTDTAVDFVAQTAFVGGLTGLGFGFDALSLYNARTFLKAQIDGIDILPVVKDGKITDFKAVANNDNLSAASVDYAEQFAKSMMARNGLFQVAQVGKAFAVASPVMRGLTSRFPAMAEFMNRSADHGILVEGIKHGFEKPESFESYMKETNGIIKNFSIQLESLYKQRNGIEPGMFDKIKGWSKKFSDADFVSKEKFGDEVRDVILNKRPSEHSAVNEAARLINEHLDLAREEYIKTFNLPKDLLPSTSEGYLNRVYNIDYMTTHENEWISLLSNELYKQDKQIKQLYEPISLAKQQYDAYEKIHLENLKSGKFSEDQFSESAQTLKGYKAALKNAEEKLQNELAENPEYRMLVDDRSKLSAREAKQLKGILKPWKQSRKKYKAQKEIVGDLKGKLFFAEEALKKTPVPETAEDKLSLIEGLKSELESANQTLRELKDEMDKHYFDLQDKAHSGAINSRFYIYNHDKQKYIWKSTHSKSRIKLRNAFEAHTDREALAKANYDTILNNTAEDTIGQIFGRLTGLVKENPEMKRTIMVSDNFLYENNFLSKDLLANTASYVNFFKRRVALKKAYGEVTPDGEIKGFPRLLNAQYQDFKKPLNDKLENLNASLDLAKIDKNLNAKERTKKIASIESEIKSTEKEINKLSKDYALAKEDMAFAVNKMLGKTRYSQKMMAYTNLVRSFAYAVRLGGIPMTMGTDLSANVLKHGMWPTIRDGILPSIKTLNGYLKGKDSEAFKKYAADAHLALNTVNAAYTDRNFGGSGQPFVPLQGALANMTDKMSHFAGNAFLINQFDNYLQRVTASITQAQFMRFMHEFKAGKLGKDDLEYLLKYGLDPNKWADRFISGWKEAGSDMSTLGSYQSHYYKWSDLEAANKFSRSIRSAVDDTIIRKGMFDAPYAMDNPIIGMLLTFKGWVMASLNHYLVPAMQKPTDVKTITGIATMLMSGALVDPLYKLANGKEWNEDSDHWFFKALSNSGVFSYVFETLNDLDVATGGTLLKNYKNERWKDRTLMGLTPVTGIVEDVYNTLGMVTSGELNQHDINRAVNLIPGANAFYLRKLIKDSIESSDYPKTRSQAHAQRAG